MVKSFITETLPALVVSMRPHQWSKNLIVFAGLIFSRNLFDPDPLLKSFGAFLVFCLISGSIYLLNDVIDLKRDRLHPEASRRPLASGRISKYTALAAVAVIIPLSLVFAVLIDPGFFVCAVLYLLLFSIYSWRLKRIVILDVLLVSAGFVLRAVAGAVAVRVPISPWLLVCTMLLALFLILGKRRKNLPVVAEMGKATPEARYSRELLDQMMPVVTAACVIAYVFYTLDPDTLGKFGTHSLLSLLLPEMKPDEVLKLQQRLLSLTSFFPLYGIFRYLYLIHHENEGGEPSSTLLTDGPLLISVFLWVGSIVLVIY